MEPRWLNRFDNFKKAFGNLEEALKIEKLSKLEKAGVIKTYEFTFELAWKTIKDYLIEKQVIVKFPKDTIKEAFRYEIIEDGDLWMDMLDKRNLMSHTYNEANADLACNLIKNHFFKSLKMLLKKLKEEL